MSNLRTPPQNIEAEKAVLGAILIDNEGINRIIDSLKSDYFYDPRNELIFEAIITLYNENKPVDVLTLTAELKNRNKLKQSGGSSYLSEIISTVPTSANSEEYANMVKECAIRRKLITYAAKFDEIARKEDDKLDDVLNEIEKDVFSVTQNSSKVDFMDSKTLIEMQMAKADEYAKNPGALRGLSTGKKSLDHLLGGLHNSDLIILAARPSVGKSAFAFDLARHVAVEQKKTIAIFSLEMPAVQVIERMLAQQTKINLWSLRMGSLNDNEYGVYSDGAGKLSEAKIFVDETAGINIMQLRSKARKLKLEHNLDLLVIDYLQLMQGHSTKGNENRTQEVGEISRSLKLLARELAIPVIALSQLNRAVENRIDRLPQLSDLRESGSIEQDADLVMFLSRDINVEQEEESDFIKVDLSVAKHRNGPIGNIHLKFIGKQTRFEDWE